MSQTLYVLVYPSRLFAAHWSFWLPRIEEASGRELDIGDRVHVTGDRLNGFRYEYVRDYNVSEDDRNPKAFAIGLVPNTLLCEKTGNTHGIASNGETDDHNVINAFDRACREIQAPGPSLAKVDMASVGRTANPPRRTEVRDCQWWLKQAAVHLTQAGMLLPLDATRGSWSPTERVEQLPRH